MSIDSTWIPTPAAHTAPARTQLRLSGPHTLPGPTGQSSAGPFRDVEPPQRRVRPWHRPRPPAQSTALPARQQREPPPHPGLQPALTTPRSLRRPRPRGPALAGPGRAWRWDFARGERFGGLLRCGTESRCPSVLRSLGPAGLPSCMQPALPTEVAQPRPPTSLPLGARCGGCAPARDSTALSGLRWRRARSRLRSESPRI